MTTQSKGLGVRLSYVFSYSVNGDNTYLTNSLRARYSPVPWFTADLTAPYTYLEASEDTGTAIQEYTVAGVGDLALRCEVNLTEVLYTLIRGPAGTRGGGENPHVVLLGLSLGIPTGAADLDYPDDLLPQVTRYFPPEAQLGSGIWKPGISLTAYRRLGMVYPIAIGSYTFGRMSTPSDHLLSDALTLGAGALAVLHAPWNLKATAMAVGVFNVQNIKYRDEFTHRLITQWDSHGWLFFLTLDASVDVYRGLGLEAGLVVPLGKTLEESPNDLDFLVKVGVKWEF